MGGAKQKPARKHQLLRTTAQEARPAITAAIRAKQLNLTKSVDLAGFPSMAWLSVRIFILGSGACNGHDE